MRFRLCFLLNCAATIFLAVIAAVLYARWQSPVIHTSTSSRTYTVIGDIPQQGLPGKDFIAATGTASSGSNKDHTKPPSAPTIDAGKLVSSSAGSSGASGKPVSPKVPAVAGRPQGPSAATGSSKPFVLNKHGSEQPGGSHEGHTGPQNASGKHGAGAADDKQAAAHSASAAAGAANKGGTSNVTPARHGAIPVETDTAGEEEVPDVVLEALGPNLEPMPPHTPVAIINCVNWHFEIILGFAQVLQMMKMNTTVYMVTQTVRAETAMQLLKRLDKNIRIRECMEYRSKDVERAHLAILVSAQEEIYIRTPGMFVFRAVKPKVALSIHHNTASYRRGLMAHVFSWHPRMYMMALAPAPLDIMTKVVKDRYRRHPGYFNWILPVYHYVPKHPCNPSTPRCQYHFTVQGRLETSRRNYTRLFDELESDDVDPRLHVKLVGNPVPEAPLKIPEEVNDVVSIHPGLPFQAYYEAIHHSAGLLPLFSTDNYIAGSKISSTVITSLICNVPLVATQALLDAYPFFTKQSCYLTKPGQTEVQVMNRVVKATPAEHAATRAALEEVRKAVLLRTIRVLNTVMQMQLFPPPVK